MGSKTLPRMANPHACCRNPATNRASVAGRESRRRQHADQRRRGRGGQVADRVAGGERQTDVVQAAVGYHVPR